MALPVTVVQKLQSSLGDDAEGRPIFKELLERKSRQIIDIYRVRLELQKGGFFFNDVDMFKRFELLQRAGCGKLTIRKQPAHSTFEWKYDMKDVAYAVLGKTMTGYNESSLLSPTLPTKSAPTIHQPTDNPKTGQNAVILPLNGVIISINGLPANFDTKLVKSISDALMAVARQNENG